MRWSTRFVLLAGSLLAACAPAAGMPSNTPPSVVAASAVPTQGHLPQVDWLAYHDELGGFTIQFPLTWQRQNPSGYPVVYSLPAAAGTTLLEKRMEINVIPGAADCKESTYDGTSQPPQTVRINGVSFLEQAGSGIATGNFYDWKGYSVLRNGTCITITFVLHSASSGVFGTEPAPFDKTAESEIFNELLNTFKFDH